MIDYFAAKAEYHLTKATYSSLVSFSYQFLSLEGIKETKFYFYFVVYLRYTAGYKEFSTYTYPIGKIDFWSN